MNSYLTWSTNPPPKIRIHGAGNETKKNRTSKKAEINYTHNDGNNDHSEHSFPELKKTIEDEEDRRETTPFPLLTPLKYRYLALTLGTLLWLPVSPFTAIIERISQPEDFWTNIDLISLLSLEMNLDLIRSYKCLLGSLCWIILGYLTNKAPVLLKPTFNPILVTPDPRIKKSTSCSSTPKSQEYHIEIYKRLQSQSKFSLKIETWTIFQHNQLHYCPLNT